MNATRLVERIRAHMEANSISQMDISRLSGLPQSTISRALKSPVRVTKTHREICKTIDIAVDEPIRSRRGQEVLVQAVLKVWDGTTEHAQSIARLLNAGATLEALATSRASRRQHS